MFIIVIVFLAVWLIFSLKWACVVVGAIVALALAVFGGIELFKWLKVQRAKSALRSVRYGHKSLLVGHYAISPKDVVDAMCIYDEANNLLAIKARLLEGIDIVFHEKYLHGSAIAFLRDKGRTNSSDAFVFPDDFIGAEKAIYSHFRELQKSREVVLCTASDAIRNFLDRITSKSDEVIVGGDDDVRETKRILDLWMNDFLTTKPSSKINEYPLLEMCKRIKEVNDELSCRVVKIKASLLLKSHASDPILCYQMYSYFDANRTAETTQDRIALMQGIGSISRAGERHIIVCTDNSRTPNSMEKKAPGVLIALAADLHEYNLSSDTPIREKFEFIPSGHPISNCTYIQHPTRKNCYIESSVYHLTILERKFVELQTVMRSVGAVKMLIDMGDSSASSSATGRKSSKGIGGKYKVVSGSGKRSSTSEGSSFESINSRLCLQGEWDPIQYRKLPDGLEFFDSEPQWKEIAAAALKGQSPEVKVRLEVKRESESALKTFRDAMLAVDAMIVGFDTSHEEEFERQSKQVSSLYWDYYVAFGKSTQQKIEDISVANTAIDGSRLTEAQRAESLILKMVHQCLIENGVVTDECKRDINEIASEYGVQKLRVLELTQCAREQKQPMLTESTKQIA